MNALSKAFAVRNNHETAPFGPAPLSNNGRPNKKERLTDSSSMEDGYVQVEFAEIPRNNATNQENSNQEDPNSEEARRRRKEEIERRKRQQKKEQSDGYEDDAVDDVDMIILTEDVERNSNHSNHGALIPTPNTGRIDLHEPQSEKMHRELLESRGSLGHGSSSCWDECFEHCHVGDCDCDGDCDD